MLLVTGWSIASAAGDPSGELRDGDLLDRTNWQRGQGLLPDEILAHYESGEYANRVADLALPGYIGVGFPAPFRDASTANAGRFDVDGKGSIIERDSGLRPSYIMGLPFPEIDPGDPNAGVKVLWNFNYVTWYGGDDHFVNELVMLGEAGVERRVQTEVRTRVYDGAPEARGRANPDGLVMQRLARVLAPTDLEGMASLSWRFRDPDRRDAMWSFVPGMRRVRQVSPLNRSDGFLGSEICLDDGPFFEGKPEDFRFRLVERRDMLILMDPFSIRGEAELTRVDGGWRILWKDTARIGADLPDWSGVPWAPVGAVLVRRPVWVVEALPRDPNYLYGRIVLRFDAETYRGTWATKYDRADQPIISHQASSGSFYTPDGGATWIAAGGVTVHIGENLPLRRATVVVFPPAHAGNPSDFHVDNSPTFFSTAALLHEGK